MEEKALEVVEVVNTEVTPLTGELTLEIIRSENFGRVYANVDAIIKKLTEAKKLADEQIKAIMKEEYLRTGNQTIKGCGIKMTYVSGGVRESFDSKTFKAEHPDEYAKYVKVSQTSDSLRVTVAKED